MNGHEVPTSLLCSVDRASAQEAATITKTRNSMTVIIVHHRHHNHHHHRGHHEIDHHHSIINEQTWGLWQLITTNGRGMPQLLTAQGKPSPHRTAAVSRTAKVKEKICSKVRALLAETGETGRAIRSGFGMGRPPNPQRLLQP